MKKSLLLVLMLVMAGCSFSKHDKDKKEEAVGYNAEVILQDYKLSNFDKTIVAIKKNDSILFYSIINKLSKNEINSLTENELSLAEIALQNDRYDFFRDLLKAGLSPFLKGYLFPSGVALGVVPRREYAFAITAVVKGLLAETARICGTGDIRELIEFMDVNIIPPTQKVCGEYNLYQTFLSENANFEDFDYVLKRYLKPEHRVDAYLNEILVFSVKSANKKLISAIDQVCRETSCNIDQYAISHYVKEGSVEEVLNSYEALLVARSAILLAPSTRRELPPPPPPEGPTNEPVIDSRIAGGMSLLSYMKSLIETRIGGLSAEEVEPFAERVKLLGLMPL